MAGVHPQRARWVPNSVRRVPSGVETNVLRLSPNFAWSFVITFKGCMQSLVEMARGDLQKKGGCILNFSTSTRVTSFFFVKPIIGGEGYLERSQAPIIGRLGSVPYELYGCLVQPPCYARVGMWEKKVGFDGTAGRACRNRASARIRVPGPSSAVCGSDVLPPLRPGRKHVAWVSRLPFDAPSVRRRWAPRPPTSPGGAPVDFSRTARPGKRRRALPRCPVRCGRGRRRCPVDPPGCIGHRLWVSSVSVRTVASRRPVPAEVCLWEARLPFEALPVQRCWAPVTRFALRLPTLPGGCPRADSPAARPGGVGVLSRDALRLGTPALPGGAAGSIGRPLWVSNSVRRGPVPATAVRSRRGPGVLEGGF
jgi:hypothetical protein